MDERERERVFSYLASALMKKNKKNTGRKIFKKLPLARTLLYFKSSVFIVLLSSSGGVKTKQKGTVLYLEEGQNVIRFVVKCMEAQRTTLTMLSCPNLTILPLVKDNGSG